MNGAMSARAKPPRPLSQRWALARRARRPRRGPRQRRGVARGVRPPGAAPRDTSGG